MKLAEMVLTRMARAVLRRQQRRDPVRVARTRDETAYRAWRIEELRGQLERHFPVAEIRGRTIVDYGCGGGELSCLLVERGAAHVTGLDVLPSAIERAHQGLEHVPPAIQDRISFQTVKPATRWPIKDQSVDLICCFDVLEHLACPGEVLVEWRRVLKKDGRVWIWWSPWRGPYGHHLDSLIPLPWVHLLFPERLLFRSCAVVYDSPDFVPRKWDLDPLTGKTKPNPWVDKTSFEPFLNRLTRPDFERHLRASNLSIARFRSFGFAGSWAARLTRSLRFLPILGECFVSFFTYELR